MPKVEIELEDFLKIKEFVTSISNEPHEECDDPWYSCPKSENGCLNENAGDSCTCGADSRNEKVDVIIKVLEKYE